MSVEALLDIQELRASIEDREILRGISLRVRHGEVHAIMGPNGSGKSTLSKVLAGHPSYTVTAGSVQFEGRELLEKEPDERSREGVFLAFQYPSEIPGVSIQNFLRTALNARREKDIPVLEFRKLLYSKMDMLGMDHSFATRFVNEGFTGLDIDALRIVAGGVNTIMEQTDPPPAVLLITHYNRILHYIKPHFVHVLHQGRIIRSGGHDLALELEERGYDWLINEAASAA
jgi:Fe-S cluster assembly ATP-binding protein